MRKHFPGGGARHAARPPPEISSLRYEISTSPQRGGDQRREVCTVSRIGAMPLLIERTDLVGMLPRWYFREVARNFDLVAHEMPMEIPSQPLCLSWHAKNTAEPGHAWLRQTILSAFRAHLRQPAAPARARRTGARRR